jgi:hypothetical protein
MICSMKESCSIQILLVTKFDFNVHMGRLTSISQARKGILLYINATNVIPEDAVTKYYIYPKKCG